jgi:hypothetical protein
MPGEAQSKCRHLTLSPLKPQARRELEALCLAKVAQATTAIEGNSLTLAQVQAAVRGDLRVPPSQEYLEHEADNVIDACRMIEDRVASTKGFELSVDLLKELRPPAAWTRRRRTLRPRRAWRSQHGGRH